MVPNRQQTIIWICYVVKYVCVPPHLIDSTYYVPVAILKNGVNLLKSNQEYICITDAYGFTNYTAIYRKTCVSHNIKETYYWSSVSRIHSAGHLKDKIK